MITTALIGIAVITATMIASTVVSIALVVIALMMTPTIYTSAWIVLTIQTVIVSACPAASRDTCRAVARTM